MAYKHNKKLTPIAKTLRKNMTKEEKHLWYDFLRTYPIRFLRQKVIGNFVVDFYCHDAKLVIELDGLQHYTNNGIERDIIRSEQIENFDLLVIRFDNLTLNKNFNGVCQYIDDTVKGRTGGIPPPLKRSPSL